MSNDKNSLEQRVSQLELALDAKSQQLEMLQSDTKWVCERCITLLGVYDTVEDVLRMRYKDHVVHVSTGDGGFVRVVCRKCSHINTIHHVSNGEG